MIKMSSQIDMWPFRCCPLSMDPIRASHHRPTGTSVPTRIRLGNTIDRSNLRHCQTDPRSQLPATVIVAPGLVHCCQGTFPNTGSRDAVITWVGPMAALRRDPDDLGGVLLMSRGARKRIGVLR